MHKLVHECKKPRAAQPTLAKSCYAFVDHYAYYYALQPIVKAYGHVSQTTSFKWLAIAGATSAGYAQRLAGRGVKRWARPFMSLMIAVLTFLDYANAAMKQRRSDTDDSEDRAHNDCKSVVQITRTGIREDLTAMSRHFFTHAEARLLCPFKDHPNHMYQDGVFVSKRPFTLFMQPRDVEKVPIITIDNVIHMAPTFDHLDMTHPDYRTILKFTIIIETTLNTTESTESVVIDATNLVISLTTIGDPYHDMNMRASLLDIASFLLISDESRKGVNMLVFDMRIVSATCSWLCGHAVVESTRLLAGPHPEQQYTLGKFVRKNLVDLGFEPTATT